MMPAILRGKTKGGISYAVESGPVITGQYKGGFTGQEVVIINASDFEDFIADICPLPVQDGVVVSIDPPRTLPGTAYLKFTDFVEQPFNDTLPADPYGADDKLKASDPAKYDATYNKLLRLTLNYAETIESRYRGVRTNEKPETILESSFTNTVQGLSIQQNPGIKFAESPTDEPKSAKQETYPLVKVIPVIDWSCRWSWALNPDFRLINSLLGTVNLKAAAFLNDAISETALFTGLAGRQAWWMGEVPVWDLEYRFAQRYVMDQGNIYSWNHEYDPDKNRWRRLYRTGDFGDKRPLYDSGDFLDLFKALDPNP